MECKYYKVHDLLLLLVLLLPSNMSLGKSDCFLPGFGFLGQNIANTVFFQFQVHLPLNLATVHFHFQGLPWCLFLTCLVTDV